MYYYRYKDKYAFSLKEYKELEPALESELVQCNDTVFLLLEQKAEKFRRSFCLSSSSLIEIEKEDLGLLQKKQASAFSFPAWVTEKLSQRQVKAINTAYPDWQGVFEEELPKQWRINLIGLGDVGSTLLIGLRLLGADKISQIGIYDIDPLKITRWEFETSQIRYPDSDKLPPVTPLTEATLFDCDMFVFCVTVGIPALDSKGIDVRMAQLEGNGRIISLYAKKAREAAFKGVFAVVSDPVDLLCKKALLASNINQEGHYDFRGLAPEQIRGYGLGVMHSRAAYYAAKTPELQHYLQEGRAFGPHGQHLVVADSITHYNQERSLQLTEKARNANLELREHGFKPYVAPALSSGAIAILETISGHWHYSATYLGGVYMGARNRLLKSGTELEQYELPEQLISRLSHSYKELESIL